MEKYIKREIEQGIKGFSEQFSAVAVIGPRQSGKTTTLKKMFAKSHAYYSLDNTAYRRMAAEDPALFIKDFPERVIIDEIQYAPDLLSFIKMEIDENPRKKGRFILTGSQNFLMMKSFTETLAGRMGVLRMPLLSVSELKTELPHGSTADFFERACLTGTYPEPALGVKSITNWYESYLQLYIERDVRTLYNIGNLADFDRFVRILSGRPGQLLNMSALASDTGVTVPTVKSWLSILEASGIIYILRPYYSNTRTRLVKSPKVYFTDIGLVCSLNNITDKVVLYRHSMLGQIFENFCVMEAVKVFASGGRREIFSFFRADKGVEVDLLAECAGEIIPIEFKASMEYTPKWATGIEAVIKGKIKQKARRGYVISLRDDAMQIAPNTKAAGIFCMIDLFKEVVGRGS